MSHALLLCLLVPASGVELDTLATLGVSVRARSTGDGLEVAPAVALGLGARPAAALPLRLEVALLTDLHRGGGGDAVSVSAWQGELAVLAGLDWRALARERRALGLELLLGPALRVGYVGLHVYDQTESTWTAGASGVGAVGAYYRDGAWRLGARLWLGVARDRAFQAGLTVGRQL